ncbi:PKD-like domain-containing protein [Flavobacterium enshiense]|nr:PKD-like domain-containing protein [Flavobacterium enshiense]
MALSGNVASTTFNWTRDNDGSVTGIAANGTGDISGTLTNATSAPVTVTFTITPTANGCSGTPITTTVRLNPIPNAIATNSNQTICSTNSIAPIVLSSAVAGATYSWTRDNNVAATGIAPSGSGDISGTLTNTTSAPVTVTFTITPTANSCTGASITATVLVQPATKGGAVTISQPNITPVVRTKTECHTATGTLYLSGHIGNVVRWESSTDAGNTWTPIANTATTAAYNYNGLTQTSMFRAVIKNEPNCLLAYSTFSMINVIPNLKPSPVIATPSTICEGDSSVLSSSSSYATSSQLATGGSFSNSNPTGWEVENCNNCLSSGGSNDDEGPFQLSSTNGKRYSGVDYTSNGKFAIAHGEGITSYMSTPVFNTFGLTNATLTFKHAYNFLAGAKGEIQLSVNGGSTYTTIQTYTGTLTPTDPFTAAANSVTIDLNAYLGQGNLKIRFYYYGIDTVPGNPTGSSWAIDDIAIPDAPTNLSTQWVDAATGQVVSTSMTMTVSPTQTTTYAITSYLNGCNSFGTDGTEYITVVVKPTPNAVATPSSQTICSGTAITTMVLSSNVASTTFNWTRDNTTAVTGISNSGTGNIIGTLTNTTNTPKTVTFTITPKANGCTGTPITTTVLVNPKPNAVATISNQTICSGTAITAVALSGNVASSTFNWTRDNAVAVTGIAASGSGNISGTLTNTTSAPVTVTFTITPTANGCSGTQITTKVRVNPIPNVVAIPSSQTICSGTPITTMALSGSVASTTFNWTRDNTIAVSGIAASGSGNISGTLTNTTNAPVAVTFTITPTANSCTGASITTTVLVNPTPNAVATNSAQTICSGTSITAMALSGSVASTAFNWTRDNAAAVTGIAASGTGDISGTLTNTTNAPVTVAFTITPKANNCNGTPITTTVLVNPTPNVAATNSNQTICSGTEITAMALSGSVASTTFNWTRDNTVAVTGIAASGTGDISGTLTNTTNAPVTVTFTITPTANGCNGIPITTTVIVNEIPTAVLGLNQTGQTACYGDSANLSVNFTGTGPWNITYSNGSATTTVNNITANPYTITVPNITATSTYTITALSNSTCIAKPSDITGSATVTVNERPTAVLGTDQTICYGDSANLTVNFTGTGPWNIAYSNSSATASVNNITENPYTITIPNNTTTSTYTITALSDSKCTAQASDMTGSATVTVLNGTPGLWTGLVSTDWFDCKNWAGGLPSATIDAVIPTGAIRMPVIDRQSQYASAYSFIASARDVIINTNASITMNANSDLEVKRDWKNSGSFIPGSGTVTFNGDTANQVQLINSGIKLNESFYNLTLNCTNGAKGINIADAFALTVSNDLVLTSGDLRLTGEAQLVQNGTSANPIGGTGVLLRDQQGTKSSYHYNYWSSPVSNNNLNYTIGSVLKDGTNAASNPFNKDLITFGAGAYFADGPLTSPIKISTRWLYKYTQISTSYWSWQAIGSTGSVKVGEGFTMKGVTGSGPNINTQNYTFVGKPNNGNINLNIAPNQLYLVGNPYPSALDANEFILDNILDNGRATTNVFNGALYFWDHFGSTTHYLAEYVGGYAVYNLTGGVAAVSTDPLINNNMATGSKIPKQFIPVAQGFFVRTDLSGVGGVTGQITGGTISFKNSQRAFKTESESAANSIFIRNGNQTVDSDIDNRQRIRLSFEAPSGLRRQLLVGADAQASNLFDLGYDAPMIDVNNDDMYWNFSDGKFVIQAVNNFDIDQIIPVGIKISTVGTTKIKIDELENIPASTEIYLFDSVTGLYHDIKNEDFVAEFPIGEYPDRFALRFTAETLSTDEMNVNNGIMVFADANHILNIKNNFKDARVEAVQLYNILGQSITKWNVADEDQRNIKIPVEHIRTGTYIVKLKTSNGSLSKKVIIR